MSGVELDIFSLSLFPIFHLSEVLFQLYMCSLSWLSDFSSVMGIFYTMADNNIFKCADVHEKERLP